MVFYVHVNCMNFYSSSGCFFLKVLIELLVLFHQIEMHHYFIYICLSYLLLCTNICKIHRYGGHYTSLYKGLEHLQILVSERAAGTNPLLLPRDDCNPKM